MERYTIGLDYGTLSGRAVLVNVRTGEEKAVATLDYPHAVMDSHLPDGTHLGVDWALQHPQDYLDVLHFTIPRVIQDAGITPDQIIGVGIDFTACTLMPVKADGTPLCSLEKYRSNPHAYIKLWKHHAAQPYATRLNEIACETNQKWLARYGGKISSEWAIPKIWQTLNEAPEIYAEADYFMEAGDWLIWQLTGKQTRNSCTAGYKTLWNKKDGYPEKSFFKALDPRLENLVEDKLNCPISPLGSKAGEITSAAAALTGLKAGTAVAVANVDAHVCVPALGIDGPGKMMVIMGTSSCHMVVDSEERLVPGICGVTEDGILPGFFGYEAGQCCVGDHFAWFVENCVPTAYFDTAKAKNISVFEYLQRKAEVLKPGESGLVALDWWNGNRCVLVDADLTGLMLGMTLQTKPEEMYRALIEATAFGTRKIISDLVDSGVPVNSLYAAGGISQKDPMTMQIYADIVNRPIYIAGSSQGPALGSAIFGAVAAGEARGGYNSVFAAARVLGKVKDTMYQPKAENSAVYDELYREYILLHDYFGRGANDVMKRLKTIRMEQSRHE